MMNPEVPFFVCLDEMNLAPVEQYFAEILSVLETRKHPQKDGGKEVDMSVIKTGVIIDPQYFKFTWKDEDGNKNVKNRDMSDKEWYDEFFNLSKLSEEEIEQVSKYKNSYILANEGLSLPDNVVIIGTVNMDDTTHQFSRKVIDRAMTIEMNGGRLANMYGGSKDLEYIDDEKEQLKWQQAFTQRYVTADEVLDAHKEVANELKELLPKRLEAINDVLKGTPFEVSYRVLNELTIMVGVLLDNENEESIALEDIINQAVNNILLMKILPRIEGDAEMFAISRDYRNKMGVPYNDRLEWLKEIAPDLQLNLEQESPDSEVEGTETKPKDPVTEPHQQTAKDKIQEMIDRLRNQEFTRFWP